MTHRGQVIIISGPSGSGKTSVIRQLMKADEGLSLGLSATTRKARPGEKDGVNYRFVSPDEFQKLSTGGELLEQAVVHSDSYGTLKSPVEELLSKGRFVVLDVDVAGARALSEVFPDATTIYLLPPSEEEWMARIRGRGTENESSIRKRLETARREKEHIPFYQHVVVNKELEQAATEILGIIKANRNQEG